MCAVARAATALLPTAVLQPAAAAVRSARKKHGLRFHRGRALATGALECCGDQTQITFTKYNVLSSGGTASTLCGRRSLGSASSMRDLATCARHIFAKCQTRVPDTHVHARTARSALVTPHLCRTSTCVANKLLHEGRGCCDGCLALSGSTVTTFPCGPFGDAKCGPRLGTPTSAPCSSIHM